MPTLTNENGIYVLHLGGDENRLTVEVLSDLEAALKAVVAAPAPLITVGDGKFFSNGLDVEWMRANPVVAPAYSARVRALLADFLTLPVPTVAALNGHTFGAGAFLAMAHDWRIMRSDRGYLCFPEVDIQMVFAKGTSSLIQSKLTPRTALDAMSTGHRYRGEEAHAVGLVDGTASEAALLETARERVAGLIGKHADTLGGIKSTMYSEVASQLRGTA